MSRMFEVQGEGPEGEFLVVIDLEKVCLVRVEKEPGHHYPRIIVRLMDGHEHHDVVPPEHAHLLVDAFRGYLTRNKG